MDIEELLRPIIAQIINMMNKRVLLLISGGAVNLKEIFTTLSSMKMLQYDIVMTDTAKKVIPQEYITNLNSKLIDCKVEMTKAVREADIILIPVMTRNTLAKCATGVQDNLVTTGIAEAIMMNKEVIAVNDSFNPQNPKNISLGFSKNHAYNKFVLGYQDNLTNWGVKFITSDDLKRSINEKFSISNNVIESKCHGNTFINGTKVDESNINEFKHSEKNNNEIEDSNLNADNKKDISAVVGKVTTSEKVLSGILTIEDIMRVTQNSKEISIKEGSLITPLAKDYIYNKKINIKYC